jgi:uncharacterized protein (TIGR02594 family)
MTVVKHALASDPVWLQEAWKHKGLKEISGSRDNPTIVSFFKDVGHGWVQDDETAWCAAFVGAMLSAHDMPHTGSLAARSYLKWGAETKSPKRGDVVVFKRGNSSWQGHVAFYLGETAGRIYVLGGNQSNSVSVTSYPKSKLLGYRTPTTPLNSRTFIGAATAGTGSVAALVETGKSVQEGLQMTGLEWAIVAAGFLGVAGACLALYARRDDWLKKGT